MRNGQQVGYGNLTVDQASHALLWNGTASSLVDLHPSGFLNSSANATSGTQQVGEGLFSVPPPEPSYHALLWSGTAASAVDLNPANFNDSGANGVGGGKQVGWASVSFGSIHHAFIWSETAASGVDLSPAGYPWSDANDTDGTVQVGSVWSMKPGESSRAALWSGTPDSFVGLQSLLPGNYDYSNAYSIQGDTVYGIARDTNNIYHAVSWSLAVPEPGTLSALTLFTTMMRRRRTARFCGR